MIYYKKELNILLQKVWNNFWPSSVLEPSENQELRKLTTRYFTFVMSFGIAATCTTVQFMYQPLILGIRSLPLMLRLPFDLTVSPIFEILYVWNACTCMCIQFSVLGFDFFFTMLTWNCAMQFKTLRIILGRTVVEPTDKMHTNTHLANQEEKEKENEETEKLIKCIEHHKQLLG